MEQVALVEKSDFRQHETTFYNAYKHIKKVIPFSDVWDVNDVYNNDKIKIILKNGEFAKSWDSHTNRLFVFLGTGFGTICIYEHQVYNPKVSINDVNFCLVIPDIIRTLYGNCFWRTVWPHLIKEQIEKILGRWSPFDEGQNLHRGTDNITDWLEWANGMFRKRYVPKES